MEPTCAVADTSNRICDSACNARCQCDEGFVRDQHGNCIKPDQCPNTYCPYNEVYTGTVKFFVGWVKGSSDNLNYLSIILFI